MAYGISPGGSEESVLHVVESATGKVLSDTIDRAQFGQPSWLPDGSFFYTRARKSWHPTRRPPRSIKSCALITTFWAPTRTKEEAIFGYGCLPSVKVTEDDFSVVAFSPGAPKYLVGLVIHGVKREFDIVRHFVLQDGAKREDRVEESCGRSRRGYRLRRARGQSLPAFPQRCFPLQSFAHQPGESRSGSCHVVVPASDVVIVNISAAGDALYVQDLDGGIGRLRRLPYDNAKIQAVKLPFDGAIQSLVTNPSESGAWLELTSWTKSPLWYSLDATSGKLTDTGLVPPSPVDYSQVESEEVKAKSADGTMVPLSIVHQRGMALDGSHPTWLERVMARTASHYDPVFRPTLLAFFERGGVYAVAHVRGGGEYGEDWHLGGQKLTKQHTIDDMLAGGHNT